MGTEGFPEEHRKVPRLREGESWLAFEHLSHRGHQWPNKMASAKQRKPFCFFTSPFSSTPQMGRNVKQDWGVVGRRTVPAAPSLLQVTETYGDLT